VVGVFLRRPPLEGGRYSARRFGGSSCGPDIRGVVAFLLCVFFLAPASAQTSGGSAPSQSKPSSEPVEIPLTSASRSERAGNAWWPTKKAWAPSDFVGDHAPATGRKRASQIATPMAQVGRLVQDATLLRGHPALSATRSGYSYSLLKAANGFSYSVSRPKNLHEALGERLDAHATEKCFGCQPTGATTVSGCFAPQKVRGPDACRVANKNSVTCHRAKSEFAGDAHCVYRSPASRFVKEGR